MDYITNNLAQSLVVIGLILLAIEVLILGFATFIMFFVGIAAVITGILIGIDILNDELLDACLAIGVLSAIIAAVSWKPLKMLQDNVKSSKTTNDMIGDRFMLPEDLNPGESITCRYSGIDWQVTSKDTIVLGAEIEIVEVSVGKLQVKQVS